MNNLIENLHAEQRKLIDNITAKNSNSSMERKKEIDTLIKNEKLAILLNNINDKQSKLRELAKKIWECEQPEADITTNDGSFHAVKVRKYPNLAALKYVRAEFENNRLTVIKIDGFRFNMFRANYKYGEPTTYTRPETFDDFLKLNSIMPQPLALPEFQEIISANEVINDNLKTAFKTAENEREKLNISGLNYFGLFGQHSEHVYTYTPNV